MEGKGTLRLMEWLACLLACCGTREIFPIMVNSGGFYDGGGGKTVSSGG
jgi:hypothetical protein